MENPIISIDWRLLAFQAFNIFVLFILLKKFLYKPLTELMESRTKEIEEGLDEAERNKVKALKLEEEYEGKIKKARQEAREIIERASRQSEDILIESKAEAKKLTEDMVNLARQEITVEKERAFDELRREVSLLSVSIAGRIIEKEIDEKTQEGLVESYLEEVGRA